MNHIRLALQQATADAHRELDRLPNVCRLLSDELAPACHFDTLCRMVAAARSIESVLESWRLHNDVELWHHPGLAERGTADLQQLARSSCEAVLACAPDINSTPAYAGAMYVLEGSALGGHFIASQWEKRGHGSRPSNYFRLPGDSPLQRWQDFCNWLNQAVSPDDIPVAADAAKATFSTFHTALS